MPKLNHALGTILILGMGIGLASSALAEISVDSRGPRCNTIVLSSITDDPNPVGVWTPYRPVSLDRMLNPDGDDRGDGWPDLFWKSDGCPVAVWAYHTGTDHDIALSRWTAGGWSPIEFLTQGTEDERAPALFVERDGTVYVVWWSDGATEEVFLSTRPAGSELWSVPTLVTTGTEEGRRPTVIVFNGALRIAYERDSAEPGMSQEVVVARRESSGAFTTAVVAHTARSAPLDATLHAADGRLWLDWKHAAAQFGSVEWKNCDWTPADSTPWADATWTGVEETLKEIRRQVMTVLPTENEPVCAEDPGETGAPLP